MNLPLFTSGNDPGPNFFKLLNSQNLFTNWEGPGDYSLRPELTHGTTVVGTKWSDGVVMAGDRRAVSGNLISHRTMEKVFPADSHSGVAIAGVAGPALEMVKLFQLQLEHYEKLEDKPLSLEGKANQLTHFVKTNLPAAMTGLVVVPIFAGFDLDLGEGRLFNYDITGGRYEEQDYIAVGSGSLHASTVIKLGFKPDLNKDEAIDLLLNGLYQAADEDTGTGGPDPLRGIYPTIATITQEGYQVVSETEVSEKFNQLIQRTQNSQGRQSQ